MVVAEGWGLKPHFAGLLRGKRRRGAALQKLSDAGGDFRGGLIDL